VREAVEADLDLAAVRVGLGRVDERRGALDHVRVLQGVADVGRGVAGPDLHHHEPVPVEEL